MYSFFPYVHEGVANTQQDSQFTLSGTGSRITLSVIG